MKKKENLLLIYNMTAGAFYAYVRSKEKVQDEVGSLEGNDGNMIME